MKLTKYLSTEGTTVSSLEDIKLQSSKKLFGRLIEEFTKLKPVAEEIYKTLHMKYVDPSRLEMGVNVWIDGGELINIVKQETGLTINIVVEYENSRSELSLLSVRTAIARDITKNGSHALMPNDMANALVAVPFYNAFNAANVSVFKKKWMEGLRGGVDLERGVVTGSFKDLKSTVYLPIRFFIDFSPEQMAAVFLHEVGHAFTFIETVDQVSKCNQQLMLLIAALNGTDNFKVKETIIDVAFNSKANRVSPQDVKEMAKKDNKLITRTFMCTRDVGNMKYSSLTDHKFLQYDETESERAADRFATLHGAGVHLASALDFIEERMVKFGGGGFQRHSDAAFIVCEIMVIYFKVVKAICLGYGGVDSLLNILNRFVGIGSGLMIFLAYYFQSKKYDAMGNARAKKNVHDRYEDPRARVVHMKRTLVNQLKIAGKGTTYYAQLLYDIKELDEMIALYSKKESIFLSLVLGRDAYNAKKLMDALEEYANNDLFVKGREFEVMAKGLTV